MNATGGDCEVSVFDAQDPDATCFHARGTVKQCDLQLKAHRRDLLAANQGTDPTGRNEGLRVLNRAVDAMAAIDSSGEPQRGIHNQYTGQMAAITRPDAGNPEHEMGAGR